MLASGREGGAASGGPPGAVGGRPRLGPAVSSPARQQGPGERSRQPVPPRSPPQSSWSPRWKEVISPLCFAENSLPPFQRKPQPPGCPSSSGVGDSRSSPPICPHNRLGQILRFSTLQTEKPKHQGPETWLRTCSQGRVGDRPVGVAEGLHGGPSRAEARPGGHASPSTFGFWGGVCSGRAFVLLQESEVRTGSLGTASERLWSPPGVPLLLTPHTAFPFPRNKP